MHELKVAVRSCRRHLDLFSHGEQGFPLERRRRYGCPRVSHTMGFVLPPPSTRRWSRSSLEHVRGAPAWRSRALRQGRPSCTALPRLEKRPALSSAASAAVAASAAAVAAAVAAAAAAAAAKMRGLSVVSTSLAGVKEAPGDRATEQSAEQSRQTMATLLRWIVVQTGAVSRTSTSITSHYLLMMRRLWVGAGMAWLVQKGTSALRGGGKLSEREKQRALYMSQLSSSSFNPDIQSMYPRPQSTAYPRPQSTAYPRPKVTVPTLLQPEAEDDGVVVTTRGRFAEVEGNPLLSRFLCWLLAMLITNRAKEVEGLEVQVDARSNREAMSGLLQSVGITFNHLRLESLEISGGATMRITGLDLKVRTLLWRRFASFKKPFEVRDERRREMRLTLDLMLSRAGQEVGRTPEPSKERCRSAVVRGPDPSLLAS